MQNIIRESRDFLPFINDPEMVDGEYVHDDTYTILELEYFKSLAFEMAHVITSEFMPRQEMRKQLMLHFLRTRMIPEGNAFHVDHIRSKWPMELYWQLSLYQPHDDMLHVWLQDIKNYWNKFGYTGQSVEWKASKESVEHYRMHRELYDMIDKEEEINHLIQNNEIYHRNEDNFKREHDNYIRAKSGYVEDDQSK